MKAGVSIVIPSWNGLDLLKRFLPSVIAAATHYSKESLAPTEIIIVDDGSSDGTASWLAEEGFLEARDSEAGSLPIASEAAPDLTSKANLATVSAPFRKLLKNETNRGFGETCNRGFEAARHALVFLLNNDVEVALDSIAPLVENFADAMAFSAHCNVYEFESGRQCGTGKLGSFSRGFIRVHRSYIALRAGRDNLANGREEWPGIEQLFSMFASGGSAMFDRKKFLDIGGFEKLLNPFYWEDVEISYRAWKRGYSVFYEPRSVVRHRVSSTLRKISRAVVRRAQQRNRLIYHWINLHDSRMMTSHIFWVILLTLTAPFRFQFGYLLAVFSALKRLPEIRRRRRQEKRLSKRSDRALFDIFRTLAERKDVFAYDNTDELRRFTDKTTTVLTRD